jgi:hypothetical protein
MKVSRKVLRQSTAISLLLLATFVATAGETGARVKIVSLRPYSGGPSAYMQVASDALCGTSVFTIAVSEPSGKEVYATALSALVAGKDVAIEVSNSTGCTGWGTRVQSLYIFP